MSTTPTPSRATPAPREDTRRPFSPRKSRTVDAVVFDVGETLVDETVEYHAWADWLGVPRHTFSALFGAGGGGGPPPPRRVRVLPAGLRP